MDTSKEYIQMCEKAVEVQELWNPKQKDYRAMGNERFEVWLPRQDQLQGMVNDNFWLQLGTFSVWIQTPSEEKYRIKFKSMEQLWLAFVMKEKFNKIWDGEDWKGER